MKIDRDERRTFLLHMLYSIIEGLILGALALNEFVFIKSMQGSSYQLGVLFQLSMIIFTLLILINEFLKRIKNQRRLLQLTGLITRLPLLIIGFFPHSGEVYGESSLYHYIFLTIFLVYYLANLIIYPTINLLLKVNYSHSNFGKLYSYATSVNKIVLVIATFVYGLLLDRDNFAFTYVFPVLALLGVGSVYLLSLIDYKANHIKDTLPEKQSFLTAVKTSAKNMIVILKTNKPYTHFEVGFMFYGFAFMVTITVITLFFDEVLHLNYSSVAFYKNGYNLLSIILLPFFGKLLGKIDPRKFGIITFSAIMLYILAIALTEYYPAYIEFSGIRIYYIMVFYIIFHGIFAATMSLLWFIGSAYFCPSDQAGMYQSVHLSLTGVRAMFAPLVGVAFYEWFGYTATFSIAIGALLIAILVMIWSYNNDSRVSHNDQVMSE